MPAKLNNYQWPLNFVYDINCDDELCKNPPKDINRAVEYVLFLLDEKYCSERIAYRFSNIIRLRYIENLTYAEIGNMIDRSPNRIRQIVLKVLRRLRDPHMYGYIQYGIEGFTNQKIAKAKNDAYAKGYQDGINNCPINQKLSVTAPITELDLSVRAYNCLMCSGIRTIQDLLNKDSKYLLRIRNMGMKSYEEIISRLEANGFNCDHLKLT